MFSARLPGDLVDQVIAVAEEEGVSRADIAQVAFEEWLDRRQLRVEFE